MTQRMLRRLGILAGMIALLVIAWQGIGAHDAPRASSPASPAHTERPHDEGRTRDVGARPAEQPSRPAEQPSRPTEPPSRPSPPGDLPPEAYEVLARIAQGGPHPYRQDGGVFQNREGRLPERPRGHYREYTVPTPGARDRGPRRIVTGGDPPTEHFYTSDHYRSFRPIEVAR